MAISTLGRAPMFPAFRDPVAPSSVSDTATVNQAKSSSTTTELSSFRAPQEASANSVLPSDSTSYTKAVDPTENVEKFQQLLNRDISNLDPNAKDVEQVKENEEVPKVKKVDSEHYQKQIDEAISSYNDRLNSDYIEFAENSTLNNMVLTIKNYINGQEFVQTLPPEIKEDRIDSLNKLVKDPQNPNVTEIA
jgi:hypothetical protein